MAAKLRLRAGTSWGAALNNDKNHTITTIELMEIMMINVTSIVIIATK